MLRSAPFCIDPARPACAWRARDGSEFDLPPQTGPGRMLVLDGRKGGHDGEEETFAGVSNHKLREAEVAIAEDVWGSRPGSPPKGPSKSVWEIPNYRATIDHCPEV